MKISYSKHGRNRWLRINDRYLGFVPDGVQMYDSIRHRKAGKFILSDTVLFRQGYHVYAGMVLGAAVLVALAISFVSLLIERGM